MKPHWPFDCTTIRQRSVPLRASSSTCTSPGSTSSMPSSPGTRSTTGTGAGTTLGCSRRSTVSRSGMSSPVRPRAVARRQGPGPGEPRVLHRAPQQGRAPLRQATASPRRRRRWASTIAAPELRRGACLRVRRGLIARNTPPVSSLHRLVHQRGRQGSSSPPGHPAGDAADVHRGLQRRPRPHGERRPPVRPPPPRLSGARPEERPRRSVGPVQPLRRHDRRAAQGRQGGREEGPRGGQGAPAGFRRQGLEEAGGRSSPRSRRRSRSSSTRATSRRLGRS